MARTISVGYNLAIAGFRGLPFAWLDNGRKWAQREYAKLAGIVWAGSTRHSIYITTTYDSTVWARAILRGYGVGQLWLSTHPKVGPWTEQTFRSLFAHEYGHLLLNTWDQRVGIPLPADLLTKLRAVYGKPVVQAAGLAEDEGMNASSEASLGLWRRCQDSMIGTQIDILFEG